MKEGAAVETGLPGAAVGLVVFGCGGGTVEVEAAGLVGGVITAAGRRADVEVLVGPTEEEDGALPVFAVTEVVEPAAVVAG